MCRTTHSLLTALTFVAVMLADGVEAWPRGKGGGGRGGGNPAARGVDGDWHLRNLVQVSSGRSSSSLPVWAWIGIGVSSFSAAAALAFCVMICCRRRLREQKQSNEKTTVKCYLCNAEVTTETAAAHRKQCARRNRAMLDKMPVAAVPGHVRCPHCRHRMRVWPSDPCLPPFKCQCSDCPVIGCIVSNGHNRINCFRCDFDVCDSCARRRLAEVERVVEEVEPSAPPYALYASQYPSLPTYEEAVRETA